MDYKELIEYKALIEDLKAAADLTGVCEIELRDAATAIETLLAEREAAVADLTSICQDSGDACHLCKHLPCAPKHDRCIGWQWRGPQKGEVG